MLRGHSEEVRVLPARLLFFSNIYAVIAQLVEQLICNHQVAGSSPVDGFFQIIQNESRLEHVK